MELIRDKDPTGIIKIICSARVENYLVSFPADAYLAAMLGLLKEALPERQLLVQDRAITESEHETFLSQFLASNQKTLVGLAVMGCIFGGGHSNQGWKET